MTKHTLAIQVDGEVLKTLQKRAKRELQSVEELAADIVRRSARSMKGISYSEKLDDPFVGYFSRKSTKRKNR